MTVPTQVLPYAAISAFGSNWNQNAPATQMGAQTADPAAYMMPSSDSLGALGGWDPAAAGPALGANWAGPNGGAPDTVVGYQGLGGGSAGNGVTNWLKNGNNLSAIFQGISALSGAYLGFQQLKAARDGLDFQKQAFQANLKNSTQTYNTSLEDRIRGRTADHAGKEQEVQAYLGKHSLNFGG